MEKPSVAKIAKPHTHTYTHTNYRRARQFDKMLTVFGMCEREKDSKTGLGKGEKRVWKEANQTT